MKAVEKNGRNEDYEHAKAVVTDILDWLWTSVVEPVLTHPCLPASARGVEPSRLWWCPTGALTLLPLHAAERDGHGALDRVISSYTPTLDALARAREHTATEADRVLIVAIPDGESPLPHTHAEARQIAAQLPNQHTVHISSAATRNTVLEDLPRHSCVHFACHASQDYARPTHSALMLHDEEALTVLDIAAKQLSGELAFLSACGTAVGGGLPDEAIHLAAALQTAGYRHVIATLWYILDKQASAIAVATYQKLRATGQWDPQQAAAALHHAVMQTRSSYPNWPIIWAPYVHFGP